MAETTISEQKVLDDQELNLIHAYWRAYNYLAAGMIYLRDKPLLKEPLKPEHVKKTPAGALTVKMVDLF